VHLSRGSGAGGAPGPPSYCSPFSSARRRTLVSVGWPDIPELLRLDDGREILIEHLDDPDLKFRFVLREGERETELEFVGDTFDDAGNRVRVWLPKPVGGSVGG